VTLATPPASQGDNLPIYTKPFVGRSAEIQKVLEWLGTPSGRLLTVVGPGGIGKTRLVVEAVRRFAGQFQDGIYLVALQPVTLEDTTVAQIANAIGISFYHGGTLKKQLLDYLRHKKMLLILDNFESCLSETPLIAEILTHARDVRLLITSHERLNLQEEWLLHLQGLDFPHTDDTTIGNFSAALLFIEYARSVSSTFSPDGQEEAIAQICGILEGIPLALELAAHWAELLPCAEIASEISHSFDLLTTRLGNVPERHISLRSVFEYAWTRLSDELRLALRQLCIFQNGFTRQAANEITNASLSTLTALVQSSTLWTDGQGRYFIPQTIKKYAEEKHEVELVLIEENHSRYYAQFIAQLDLDGPGQSSALAQVKVEFDNILAGWNWAMTTLNAEILAVYCHPLYVFYEILSRFSEGQDTFGRAVDILSRKTRLSSEDRILLGRLKSRLGYFHTNLGDYDQALRLFDESLALQPSNYKEVAFIFNLIGVTCIARGQLSEARQHLEKSLEIYDELKEDLAAARVLNNLGMLANSQSDYTRAVNVLCQSLQTFRRFGSRRFMAAALNNLGNAAFASGDLISAEQYFNESYQLKDELGDNWGIACSLINLGHIAVAQGHQAQAKQAFSRSLDVCTRMGKQSGIAKALTALGSAASEEGNYAASSYYFLEALQLSLTIGARVTSLEVLKDIAAMLIKRGYLAEAAQIAHSIIKEPQTHRQTRQEAEKILHAISEVLPPHSHTETLDEIKERVLKNVYFPLIPLLQASSNVSVTDNS
jgi:predicted ATPase/Tfp pilus assembly protein PilF